MDYHIQQLAIHCRICGRRVIDHRGKSTYRVYKCKELAESLQPALAIDVKDDSTATHPECVCKPCKLTTVHARGTGVPKKHIIPFQWYAHKAEGCRVRNKVQINNYTNVEICNIRQLCEHFQKTSKGVRIVKSIRQTGVWPSTLIKHIQVIAPTTVTGPGCPGPLTICLAQANWNANLCFEILSQSIELLCSVLV